MLIFLTLVIILTVSIYTNLFIFPFLFHVEDFCFCSSFCKFLNFFFYWGGRLGHTELHKVLQKGDYHQLLLYCYVQHYFLYHGLSQSVCLK